MGQRSFESPKIYSKNLLAGRDFRRGAFLAPLLLEVKNHQQKSQSRHFEQAW